MCTQVLEIKQNQLIRKLQLIYYSFYPPYDWLPLFQKLSFKIEPNVCKPGFFVVSVYTYFINYWILEGIISRSTYYYNFSISIKEFKWLSIYRGQGTKKYSKNTGNSSTPEIGCSTFGLVQRIVTVKVADLTVKWFKKYL